ncbi:hypothetical protein EZH22_26425 [Xanthobacter dioxanivorans]|uniref:Uncharacterized protein n=1 Tax=Xanthobacter dioxanivorans TaxID=2528964 RepID=A0A974PNY1_9HYPH|nr:hypothetical protein [Xanthobacter dioxanivorans]QRG06440.1 hypothetical protein EZH22_26425 [Xanthobacter dioxanivorans]
MVFNPQDKFDPLVFRLIMRCAAAASVTVSLLGILILIKLDPATHGPDCSAGIDKGWHALPIAGAFALSACIVALRWRDQVKKIEDYIRKGERPMIYGMHEPIPTSYSLFFLIMGAAMTLFCAIPIFFVAGNCSNLF